MQFADSSYMCLYILVLKMYLSVSTAPCSVVVFTQADCEANCQHDAPGARAVRRAEEGPPGHGAPHRRSGEGHPGGRRVSRSVPLSVHPAKSIKCVVICHITTKQSMVCRMV